MLLPFLLPGACDDTEGGNLWSSDVGGNEIVLTICLGATMVGLVVKAGSVKASEKGPNSASSRLDIAVGRL